MPFINAKFSNNISNEKEIDVKNRLGKAISLIPGKSEAYLMLNIEDNQRLYFKGDNSKPIAFFEVKLLGKSTRTAYEALTKELCSIANDELGISSDCVYVKFEEVENWGYNSFMF